MALNEADQHFSRARERWRRMDRGGGFRAWLVLATILVAAAWQTPARCAEDADGEPLDPDRWEPGVLPALNYDSDIGLGFGAIGSLARFEQGYEPYRFRMEAQLFASATLDAAGDVTVPFHDHFVTIDFPDLVDGVRLGVRLAFAKFSNSGYYGLGNLSEVRSFSEAELEDSESARRYHTYDRATPSVDGNLRIRLFQMPARRGKRQLELFTGLHASYSWVNVYPGSELAEDRALSQTSSADGRTLAELLHGLDDHLLLGLNLGLLWDSRDHEFSPSRGNFTELSTRISPGVDAGLSYGEIYFGTSWFAPLWRDHLVVASRSLADVQIGDPPLYELSRFGILVRKPGPGGSSSVRGVALQRYHGKLKVITNLELRGMFPWFRSGEERLRLGLVAFGDAGRVWTDWQRREVAGRDLDGPSSPFKLGVGGGGRFQWGETFLIRADLAHSPTDDTTGFYIDVGHLF